VAPSRRPANPATQKPPGKVHDSKQIGRVPAELIEAVRARLGRSLPLEIRMDAAFFQRPTCCGCSAADCCAYANQGRLLELAAPQQLRGRAAAVARAGADVAGFEHQLVIPP